MTRLAWKRFEALGLLAAGCGLRVAGCWLLFQGQVSGREGGEAWAGPTQRMMKLVEGEGGGGEHETQRTTCARTQPVRMDRGRV